jgi:hypothetical protein
MSGLLDSSKVLMYGRVLKGVTLDVAAAEDNADHDEVLVDAALLKSRAGVKQLATIYGFEFEGHYYDLPTPAVMLVHGDPQTPVQARAVVESDPKLMKDVKVWTNDKDDYSVRLDVSSGPLEAILLEEALDDSAMAAQTSAKRISGKRVSGKRVSGKRMSGD